MSIAIPGHVAQMQKLFQSAKASLRLDVKFASSPNGSINSRLPPESDNSGHDEGVEVSAKSQPSSTPMKSWRNSTAPCLLAELDIDVREPFPDSSPQLPDLPAITVEQYPVITVEPFSSGFTSPTGPEDEVATPVKDAVYPSPELCSSSDTTGDPTSLTIPYSADIDAGTADLAQPMTELHVSGHHEADEANVDDSPLICHLKRQYQDIDAWKKNPSVDDVEMDEEIILSGQAKAAAEVAKAKRRHLSDMFPLPPRRNGSSISSNKATPETQTSKETAPGPCPDPSVHLCGPPTICPDPALHFGTCTPHIFGQSVATPNPNMQMHATGYELPPPMEPHRGPFNRTTANGSPMPFRVQPPQFSRGRSRRARVSYDSESPPLLASQRPPYCYQDGPGRFVTSYMSQHFQPGWYYTGRPQTSSGRPEPAMYSFSTAASKAIGSDQAPDSRIRDSYRTDTLTPLAKPASRFRKNGIIALANERARGIGKYYSHGYAKPHPSGRPGRAKSHRVTDAARYRSSPPLEAVTIQPRPLLGGSHRRRVSHSGVSENETYELLDGDDSPSDATIDPKLRLEEGEELIELDEETRAAVRMSLFGAHGRASTVAEGRGAAGEIVRSPAARRRVRSPVYKEEVASQQGEVQYEDGNSTRQEVQGMGTVMQKVQRIENNGFGGPDVEHARAK